jgi:hypothetical protein
VSTSSKQPLRVLEQRDLHTFSYRLGVLGNLTSQELRGAGYPGNNSLRDQKCALQWIKAHIDGFRGDSKNITVSGESAGSGQYLVKHFGSFSLIYCKWLYSINFSVERPFSSAPYP